MNGRLAAGRDRQARDVARLAPLSETLAASFVTACAHERRARGLGRAAA